MVGIGLGILAAVFWGLSAVLVRYGLQRMNAATGTFVSLVSGSAVVWLLAVAFNLGDLRRITLTTALWFAAIGALNFPLGRFFNYLGISHIGISRSTPMLATSPLFALVFAVLFLQESISPLIVLGVLLVLAGVYLTVREGLRA